MKLPNREDTPDRKFLRSWLWCKHIRPKHLGRHPTCKFCDALGLVTAAEEVDHILRPHGDKRLQRSFSNLQSLCSPHHKVKSKWEERNDGRPLTIGIGVDGWPIVWEPGAGIQMSGE
jgi:5-methylcytosine-specific restriction protein A